MMSFIEIYVCFLEIGKDLAAGYALSFDVMFWMFLFAISVIIFYNIWYSAQIIALATAVQVQC